MRSIYFSLLVASLGLASCGNDDDTSGFADGTGIEGRVMVQNEFQQPLYEERDGIHVLLEVGFQDFSLSADIIGKYTLQGAPVGTYTAQYIKEGYGTITARDIKVSNTSPTLPVTNGLQRFPTVTLTQKPNTVFENLAMDLQIVEVENSLGQVIDTLYTLTLDATMVPGPPPTGQAKGYRIFLGTDADVSEDNFIWQTYAASTDAEIQAVYEDDWFNELEIGSGDVIFAAIYGDANFDYFEIDEGELVFPNVSEDIGALGSAVLP